ncbi:MAG: hypothetical protein LBQ20_03815 [Rhodanobacter sp.]|jgi:hypothetical protein|nr:hypothetical protein [Rhodanobacter sp.]
MSVPEHLWRYPTSSAIDSLAKRFEFPNTPEMQDWEWEVANPKRISEFLDAYENGQLTDDERFTLMEIIIQSFEDLGLKVKFDPEWQHVLPMALDPRWHHVLVLLDQNIDLHAYSVWYWSDLENENEDGDDQWQVTPFLRSIVAKHRNRLEHRKPSASQETPSQVVDR